jgi:hypothetical protein
MSSTATTTKKSKGAGAWFGAGAGAGTGVGGVAVPTMFTCGSVMIVTLTLAPKDKSKIVRHVVYATSPDVTRPGLIRVGAAVHKHCVDDVADAFTDATGKRLETTARGRHLRRPYWIRVPASVDPENRVHVQAVLEHCLSTAEPGKKLKVAGAKRVDTKKDRSRHKAASRPTKCRDPEVKAARAAARAAVEEASRALKAAKQDARRKLYEERRAAIAAVKDTLGASTDVLLEA